jgi:hypothetical protein
MDDDDAGTEAVMLELRALRSSGWPAATSPGCMWLADGWTCEVFFGECRMGILRARRAIANLFLGPAWGGQVRSDLIED